MISTQAEKELQYYVGKLCSIITKPVNLPITEATHSQWFTVRVDAIDQEQIWGTDVGRGTKSTFFFPIVSIVEEQVITEDDPNYDEVRKTLESKIAAKPLDVNEAEPEPPKPAVSCCGAKTSCKERAADLTIKDIIQKARTIQADSSKGIK